MKLNAMLRCRLTLLLAWQILLLLTLFTLLNRAQTLSPEARKPLPLPILNADRIDTDEELAPSRISKGKNYDKMGLRLEDDGQSTRTAITSHWWVNVPALPFTKSDLVILGTVTSEAAHLSADRTGIYSEYSVQITEVLLDKNASKLAKGRIHVDQAGGQIKFPSGTVKTVLLQPPLSANTRYLLFLRKHEHGTNFQIVTGYCLDSGRVQSLDRAPQFKQYSGTEVTIFLQRVRSEAKRAEAAEKEGVR